jgi:hypothetical protein
VAAVQRSKTTAGWYDFPSREMAAVYRRMGLGHQGAMIRMAKPLLLDRLLRTRGGPWMGRIARPFANAALAWSSSAGGKDPSIRVEPHVGQFSTEFDGLMQDASVSYEACIERSATFLNWRYAEHPIERCECFVARRSGRLSGYVIFTASAEDAILVDLFCLKLESIPDALLRYVATELRRRGIQTISVPIVEGHPWMDALRNAGFRPRETGPFVVEPGVARHHAMFQNARAPWHFMQGDRDS